MVSLPVASVSFAEINKSQKMYGAFFCKSISTECKAWISGFSRNCLRKHDVIKTTALKCSSYLKKIIYENSIFFAFDSEALSKSTEKYKDLTWKQKFTLGVGLGVALFIPRIILILSLSLITLGCKKGQPAQNFDGFTIREAVLSSILEEIILRGVVQNAIAAGQKIPLFITPSSYQNNKVFKWITSPSARILCTNALFAALHLANGGGYLSTLGSIIQASSIFLSPSESILYETTGSLMAPIGCHLANNLLAVALESL